MKRYWLVLISLVVSHGLLSMEPLRPEVTREELLAKEDQSEADTFENLIKENRPDPFIIADVDVGDGLHSYYKAAAINKHMFKELVPADDFLIPAENPHKSHEDATGTWISVPLTDINFASRTIDSVTYYLTFPDTDIFWQAGVAYHDRFVGDEELLNNLLQASFAEKDYEPEVKERVQAMIRAAEEFVEGDAAKQEIARQLIKISNEKAEEAALDSVQTERLAELTVRVSPEEAERKRREEEEIRRREEEERRRRAEIRKRRAEEAGRRGEEARRRIMEKSEKAKQDAKEARYLISIYLATGDSFDELIEKLNEVKMYPGGMYGVGNWWSHVFETLKDTIEDQIEDAESHDDLQLLRDRVDRLNIGFEKSILARRSKTLDRLIEQMDEKMRGDLFGEDKRHHIISQEAENLIPAYLETGDYSDELISRLGALKRWRMSDFGAYLWNKASYHLQSNIQALMHHADSSDDLQLLRNRVGRLNDEVGGGFTIEIDPLIEQINQKMKKLHEERRIPHEEERIVFEERMPAELSDLLRQLHGKLSELARALR